MKRRHFLKKGLVSLASLKAFGTSKLAQTPASAVGMMSVETDYVKYVIGSNGQNLHFIDKQSGQDYCLQKPTTSMARAKINGQDYDASEASYADGRMTIHFGQSGVNAVIKVGAEKHYFLLEVLSISDEHVEEMTFFDLPLTLRGTLQEPFAGCALALNLKTNVPELPGANSRLRVSCYARFGFTGAQVAIIGCPQSQLQPVMKEVVSAAEELPHSPLGGPWAMEAEINRGSYLFNFGNLSEETVNDWIRVVQSLGFNQVDMNGGESFRFGDCRLNPKTYPRGLASVKAVTDKFHAAGIKVGLHTYSFFIDKGCPWVTPVPDPRLAKDATFTLAESITSEATTVPVVEPTQAMSTKTGFFVRNSVTLQIDEELITYSGVSKEPPYAFTTCRRGACGTHAASHARGAKAHHLKECFGLFVPDADSTLLSDVAAKSAELFNEGGFDMIYLDALDGEDILGGGEYGWHYGSKFVFELWQRLQRPCLMEASTFTHHLWYVRSRMGAWDTPARGHKKYIDIHCAANEDLARMFLPGQLGWMAARTWSGLQGEPTFTDDIEYLCGKALGTDAGLSLMFVDPESAVKKPALQRLLPIFKNYETFRHAHYFSDSIKAKLRVPGDEFNLLQDTQGNWRFQPAQYAKHKVEGLNGWSNTWQTRNKFHPQPLQLRIEALMSAGSYEAPQNVTLTDFSDPEDFNDRASAAGITADLRRSSAQRRAGSVSGCYTASNPKSTREATWTKRGKTYSPPLDLSQHQALGVWVHGDCQGELLNFQLQSPEYGITDIGEHYVIVDFTGWRYFELIEPEAERFSTYSWPYSDTGLMLTYQVSVDYNRVSSLCLWYNNLPPHQQALCYLSPIKALPLVKMKLRNPAFTFGTRTITFPTEIESGCYVEFQSMSDCKLYSPEGKLISEVEPRGEVPILQEGDNRIHFNCDVPTGNSARANVTIISRGEPLRQ
jgi:hypothetical protein